MIQIDHGIPIPPAPPLINRQRDRGPNILPWKKLLVGDSFVFPGSKREARMKITDRRRFDNATYEARAVVESGSHAVRIWRVE